MTTPLPTKSTIFNNPYFKLLLIINCIACLVCLGIMVWAASFQDDKGDMPRAKERLYSTCSHVFVGTTGAFIGLLCGRAAAPDAS